jgi:hypothetical protein
MKIICTLNTDCLACFDNVLFELLHMSKTGLVSQIYYRKPDSVIVDTSLPTIDLLKKLTDTSPVAVTFSHVKDLTDDSFSTLKSEYSVYTKSII